MNTITGSPVLTLLRARRVLRDRLRWLGIHDLLVARWLADLDEHRPTSKSQRPSAAVLRTLRNHAVICSGADPSVEPPVADRHRKPSLSFVQALDFELTYDCNQACSHCLQQGLRQRHAGRWLSTDACKRAIQDAWFAGLVTGKGTSWYRKGVNFTGGEVFQPNSNLVELVEAARSLEVEVRINTNGWWGDQECVRVGRRNFRSSGHIIAWLREIGVGALALSLDSRYEQNLKMWHPVVAIVRECERQGQPYEFVCTGVGQQASGSLSRRLVRDAGIVPRHLIEMEMVDIGGAAKRTGGALQAEAIAGGVRRSDCGGKGFFRPQFLHVGPDGGVRTCLYAPGGGWLGNINRESLLDIVVRFADNPVTTAFSTGKIASLANELVKPYAYIYRSVDHPCAASALLARSIEHSHETGCSARTGSHERIADDMNLRMADTGRL